MLYLLPPQSFLSSFSGFPALPSARMDSSPYTIVENDQESKLEIDFPGAKPEDIIVTFGNGTITIINREKDFSETFAVDPSKTNMDKVEAFLIDGVLTVLAPKHPKPDPVRIPLAPDLSEDENSSRVTVDLPGVKAKNVSVVLDNSYVVVKASREVRGDKRKFRKAIKVDAPNTEQFSQMKACLRNGVLTIHVPRTPKPEPVKILIQTEEDPNPVGEDIFRKTMDMPGVKVGDVTVQLEDDVLHIAASRTFSNGKVKRFSKVIDLDKLVKRDLLRAELVDGVLSVTAPQDSLPSPRTITVVRKTAI